MAHPPFDRLQQQIQGTVIQPTDKHYDEYRQGWNGYFDKNPQAIVACKSADGVVHTLHFVKEYSLPFSVKSGGHDYAGHSIIDNGLVIDLSGMKKINVNPDKKTVMAEAGNRWVDVDRETAKYNLATTGGTVSTVGIAGYTLGGGSGYLARKAGLAVDNLISAEVVLSSGEKVVVSENENSDLFWALRGGSGNFGIVTSFEYRLHEIPEEIMAGQIVHPFKNAGDGLKFYRDFMEKASDNLTCYAFFLNVPPVEVFPEKYHGKTALFLILAHFGSKEETEEELQPLLNFGDPILKAVQPMPYTQAQTMFDDGMAKGNRWYSKAHYLDSLPDQAINTLLTYLSDIPGPFSSAYLEPMGGAVNRVNKEATAFPHRNAAYGLHIFPGWSGTDLDQKTMKWAKDFFNDMKTFANGGVYVNLLGHDEQNRIESAFGSNYQKLKQIKQKYDPENLFNHNHNIKPES
ncbi:FAD-binding oxidoreductase [Rhodohalobacter sp.]|uniref:FAD-binding oxidoreductase n=1 Tax=Rhodohalobacter sp. TaxID=1974210 RepID=UPI003567E6BC